MNILRNLIFTIYFIVLDKHVSRLNRTLAFVVLVDVPDVGNFNVFRICPRLLFYRLHRCAFWGPNTPGISSWKMLKPKSQDVN